LLLATTWSALGRAGHNLTLFDSLILGKSTWGLEYVNTPNHDCKPKPDQNCELPLKSDWLLGILFQDQQRS